MVWGTLDRCFTLATAERLAAALPNAELVQVPDATTFVSIDRSDAVTAAILDALRVSRTSDA